MNEAARPLGYYDFGRTTVYACRLDQRFSYCAHVPSSYRAEGRETYRLLVVVHGTARDMIACRDSFADFAERHDAIVLAPLFPCGITGPDDLSSYKMLRAGALHYDAVLLSMVEEIRARYRVPDPRFALSGFSGGGHFAHRFFYLHPERLAAVSIAAPGVVTLLDDRYDFWAGVRDFHRIFGKRLDLDLMRRVPVHMVIGGEDTETWEITIRPGHTWWMEGAEIAGSDRIERMRSLKASFERHGIGVRHDVVAGTAHKRAPLMPATEDFLHDAFSRWAVNTATETNRKRVR